MEEERMTNTTVVVLTTVGGIADKKARSSAARARVVTVVPPVVEGGGGIIGRGPSPFPAARARSSVASPMSLDGVDEDDEDRGCRRGGEGEGMEQQQEGIAAIPTDTCATGPTPALVRRRELSLSQATSFFSPSTTTADPPLMFIPTIVRDFASTSPSPLMDRYDLPQPPQTRSQAQALFDQPGLFFPSSRFPSSSPSPVGPYVTAKEALRSAATREGAVGSSDWLESPPPTVEEGREDKDKDEGTTTLQKRTTAQQRMKPLSARAPTVMMTLASFEPTTTAAAFDPLLSTTMTSTTTDFENNKSSSAAYRYV